FPVDDDDK
nr:trypsinogen 2nd activation peptide [Bos taurus]